MGTIITKSASGGGGINGLVPLGSGLIYSNIPNGVNNANASLGAGNLHIMPFIPAQSFITSNLFINVAVLGLGVSARILLYSHSKANGLPDAKLYESPNLDCSTTGVKTATTTQNFTAGTTYWLGIYTNGATQTSGASSTSQTVIGAESSTGVYTNIQRSVAFGTAPDTWGTVGPRTANTFTRIGLTVA
jgi:hypothetical protein